MRSTMWLLVIVICVSSTTWAADADYLLRLLVDEDGVPPSALTMPYKSSPKGPKKGLGPVLHRITQVDPIFRRSYYDFLQWLDTVNSKLAAAGGGAFRMQAIMRGAEDFARAIELMGGSASCDVKANDLGISWDTMMQQARVFASRALRDSALELTDFEHGYLANLFALGSITGAANRVLPDEYMTSWRQRHPEYSDPPTEPQEGIKSVIWAGVAEQIPWMYHGGSMPWLDPQSKDAHDYYDTFHFFSHAWMVHYNLYRKRYFKKGLFSKGFAEVPVKWRHVRRQFWYSNFIGFGYEVMTVAVASGFVDMTPTEELPAGLKTVAQFLHIGHVPIVEAIRDTQINHDGAEFGAALAVSAMALDASHTEDHENILASFKAGTLTSDEKSQ